MKYKVIIKRTKNNNF